MISTKKTWVYDSDIGEWTIHFKRTVVDRQAKERLAWKDLLGKNTIKGKTMEDEIRDEAYKIATGHNNDNN